MQASEKKEAAADNQNAAADAQEQFSAAKDGAQQKLDAAKVKFQDFSTGPSTLDTFKDPDKIKQLSEGLKILIGLFYFSGIYVLYSCCQYFVDTNFFTL